MVIQLLRRWDRTLPRVTETLRLFGAHLDTSPPAVRAAPRPPRAHLWAAVLASSTPAPCIHVRTAFIPATMGSSFILLPLLWMLSWIPNIKAHLYAAAISLSHTLSLLSHSLSSSPRLPPFSPWLPSSCVCLIALSEEQSGVVCFTWRLVAARVSQSKQKMRHAEGKRGAVSIQG